MHIEAESTISPLWISRCSANVLTNSGRQASPISCKAAHFSRLEERPINNCIPACTRPPRTAAVQLPSVSWLQPALHPPPHALTRSQAFESSVYHSSPWSPPHPGHVQGEKPDWSTFQPKLMGWVCTLQVSPYHCVMSIIYPSCLPPPSLPKTESTFHDLVRVFVQIYATHVMWFV